MNVPKVALSHRAVTSVFWNILVKIISLPLGFIKAIILAHFLPVEDFGIVAGMVALTTLTSAFFEFGFSGAYYHHSPETEDEERATRVFLTLRLLSGLVWGLLMTIVALIFMSGWQQLTLLLLTATVCLMRFVDAPRSLLVRRVQHRRLAMLDLGTNLSVFIVSVLIAVYTRSIWALLIAPILSSILSVCILYVWRPVWRPHLSFDKPVIQYFLRFGSQTATASTLRIVLDYVDDLWTNIFLGNLQMGYYSYAFKFATYPRAVLAEPVTAVAQSTYAELKYHRQRLSEAFFNINALLIRSGFLLGGWLAVIAPQFIYIFLGEKWLPMLEPFQLMLVYSLFDPVKNTIAGTLVAVGKPGKVSVTRLVQLIILVAGLFIFGFRLGIVGVALAVNLMLLVGIGLLLYYIKPYVDYSLARLFIVPLGALLTGLGLTWIVTRILDINSFEWLALIVKSAVFVVGYTLVLLKLEGRFLVQALNQIKWLWKRWT